MVIRICYIRCEISRNPPYSQDLVFCDFFLFKNLKKNFRGKRFPSDNKFKF
ncbi:hypothetical protein WH47_02990 [Habropoda laboriosa]|uniref:Histone-lysine N-methyltransferase SETMAR n=1 Tax=Habropoda laboriosa TaxID=597456 RepID=A0A0L7QSV4_9HYME|nr:hypothetical protein WH47_02990 [Habropoda laboriosa]